MTGPRPLRRALDALTEAAALVGTGTYKLGALDSEPGVFDCFKLAVRTAYGIPGHRPGFNRGWSASPMWPEGATVVDDLNSNSAIEDAFHASELFEVAPYPRAGDILAYPTIHLPGHPNPWVGHAAICTGTARAGTWDPTRPVFALLDIIESVGANGRNPTVRRNTGIAFDTHNRQWPNPWHCSRLLRVKP